eukprot:COSAG06_NODE_15652_length_1055_cov_0.938285_1_plen_69_part_00
MSFFVLAPHDSAGRDTDARVLRIDAMQQELDMIPLMMDQGFKAKGWLGLILGTRMYLLCRILPCLSLL